MAAISDDTAALVAAQLTAAWATRAGVTTEKSLTFRESEIAEVYIRFRNAVREVDLPKAESFKVL